MYAQLGIKPNIHCLVIVSSVAERLNDRRNTDELRGTLSDKIHVEDFAYNHKNYILHETVMISKSKNNNIRTLERVIDEINELLGEVQEGELAVIFMTGHGRQSNGDFILDLPTPYHLSFGDMMTCWDRRPQKAQTHLLLILDFCFAGWWVNLLTRAPRPDVSIQASSTHTQKSYDIPGVGAVFMNNFLYTNGYKDLHYSFAYKRILQDGSEMVKQMPVCLMADPGIPKLYDLKVGFSDWYQMEWRNTTSPKGKFISSNGDEFEGEFKSIQLNGPGTKRLINKCIVTGTFRNDKLEGKCTVEVPELFKCEGHFEDNHLVGDYEVTLTTGEVIKGNYSQDQIEDRCRFMIGSDGIYEGQMRNNKPHGTGTFYYADSDIYSGEWVEGRKEGQAVFKDKVGSRYWGDFKNDKANGRGKFVTMNGDLYVGEVKSGKAQGKGRFVFSNGDTYEGTFTKNTMDGEGLFVDRKGNRYQGQYSYNRKAGRGIFKGVDGEYYEGEYVYDQKQGEGLYRSAAGDTYIGQFANDLYHGPGKLVIWNGDSYEGEFAGGKYHGKGVLTDGSGRIWEGEFVEGVHQPNPGLCDGK
jgi:hypothetical protein